MSTLDVTVREALAHRRLADGAFVLLCYVVVAILEGALVAAFDLPVLGWVDLVAALPIALVLAFGPMAVWTVPVGSFVASLIGGAGGVLAVVLAVAHAYMAYAAHVLFRRSTAMDGEATARAGWRQALTRYLLVIVTATAGAGAIVAWGGEMARTAPFFVTVVPASVGYLVLNLFCAVPLAAAFRRTLADGTEAVGLAERLRTGPRTRSLRGVVAVTGVWILVGTLGSIGYRTLVAVPTDAFTRRGLDVVLALEQPTLFGPGAGRLQVLFGAVMFVWLLVTLHDGREVTEQ